MRSVLVVCALVLGRVPGLAQGVEASLDFGLRAPLGGELVVPVPAPAQSGFLSIPRTFSESNGAAVGANLRIPVKGAFAVTTGVSATFAERVSETPDVATCGNCGSTLLSGGVGVAMRQPVSPRLRLEAGVGGELIHLGGEAYDSPLDVRAAASVVPTRRTVGAAAASLGARYLLPGRSAVRLDFQLRRYRVTSRWTDPDFAASAGEIESSPYTDVRVTLGWTPRARP